MLLNRRGDALLQQGRAAEAEQVFRGLLARLEAGAAYEAAYDIAMTQALIGRCLAAQGQPAQAIAWHRQALDGFERLSATNKSAKEMLGVVYADLGDNLAAIGQFVEAQKAYEDSVEKSKESDNQRQIGVALAQLGTLALQRNDLAEAKRRYMETLETFRALGEPQQEAYILHLLGSTALEAGDLSEAEKYYRNALQLYESLQDVQWIAGVSNQLAIVAKNDGRPADAERWYLRTLEHAEFLHDKGATAYSNLAGLYLGQNRLAEAEQYARRALAIKETLDLSAEPWKTYNILAQIAAAQGRPQEARTWRRKEQESFAAYAGAVHQLPSWAPKFINAVVAAARGNQEAQKEVSEILPQLAQTKDWRNLPPVVERILAGETDEDALCDGLDHIDAYIIRTILAQLAGEAPA